MIILLAILAFAAGAYVGYTMALSPYGNQQRIYRLIQKEFGLKKNEYSLEYNQEFNEYILVYDSQSYVLKLSNKRPLRIVSIEEIQ
ncbi:hypothetical protein ACJQ40_002292 [Enterococcus faecium]|nr:hypothetical protein [Enterococcus faecium]